MSSADLRYRDLSARCANGLRLVDATPRRNYEGLWIHDTDRAPFEFFPTRSQAQTVDKIVPRHAGETKRSTFEAFMQRLRLGS